MDKLIDIWNDFDFQKRLFLIVGFLSFFVFIIVVSFWLLKPDFQTLYADLEVEEVRAITKVLDAEKIEYQLAEGGRSILVDKHILDRTRVLLSEGGLSLANSVGFEIFDEADYGMTDFTQKINYQRSLQGELERTIRKIHGVSTVRVHLVLPENKLFQKEKEEPKAAVNVHMKPGMTLSSIQVKGIQSLVSSAVDGLEAGLVSVFGQNGELLSLPLDEDGVSSGARFLQKETLERYLLSKANLILESVYGPGVALVSVNIDLNYNERIKKSDQLVPSSINGRHAVIKSHETRVKKQLSESGGKDKDTLTDVINETSDLEYAFGRSFEEERQLSGSISRMTVSILVPRDVNDVDLESLTILIANALGVNQERGDIISAKRIDVFKSDESGNDSIIEPMGSSQSSSLRMENSRYIEEYLNYILISLAAVILLFALILIRRSDLSKEERKQIINFIRQNVSENP